MRKFILLLNFCFLLLADDTNAQFYITSNNFTDYCNLNPVTLSLAGTDPGSTYRWNAENYISFSTTGTGTNQPLGYGTSITIDPVMLAIAYGGMLITVDQLNSIGSVTATIQHVIV